MTAANGREPHEGESVKYQPKPVGEPLSMTFEEAIAEVHKHEWRIHFHHDGFVELETFSGDDLAYEEGLLPALSYALGRPVVARDEASELRAALEGACERLELILTAHTRGFGRDYIESCALVGVDKARAALRRHAGGESQS